MPSLLRALALAVLALLILPGVSRAAEPFVVLAYNVANWLVTDRFVDDVRVPAAPKPEDEKNAVVETIIRHRPAVIGLTEMGTREDLADLRGRLKAKGFDYPHSEWVDGPDSYRHVALLSHFPIVARNSQTRVPFELDGKPQHVQRGILDVTVEVSRDYRLRLLGLHLKSRRKVEEFDEAALRAKEAWHVRRYLDEILTAEPDARVLLFGDLNDTKNEYPVKHLMGPRSGPLSMTDILLTDSRGDRWTHYWRTADEYSRIDFFLGSENLRDEIDRAKKGVDEGPDWLLASDHRAIFVTINPPAQ